MENMKKFEPLFCFGISLIESVERMLYGRENAPMEQKSMGDYNHSTFIEEHGSFPDADDSCFDIKGSSNTPISSRKCEFQDMRDLQSVGCMSRELYKQFAVVEDGQGFECVGSGNLVAFTIREVDEVLLFDFYC
ncbi:hypothetical protein ACLOJK_009870 [Asimina triloba]